MFFNKDVLQSVVALIIFLQSVVTPDPEPVGANIFKWRKALCGHVGFRENQTQECAAKQLDA